ncbi:MAG: type II toxin-antitoxin system VapC family toxin [Kiritimatiellae bacterium]|nr:type II toxin-antitoxin system VapC family toxin [Kiritimatiellia bacterium]
MRYLVDTCVLSELRKKKPNPAAVSWLQRHFDGNDFFISAITIAEILHGIRKLNPEDPRRKPLTEWLESDIIEKYGDSILPFDMDAAKKWGEIMAEADSAGHPRPPLDAQIVAIALAHNLVIVTRNVSDMSFAGVKVVNPFSK